MDGNCEGGNGNLEVLDKVDGGRDCGAGPWATGPWATGPDIA